MLNAGVVPVVPQLGSVGASGDLAPLSHLAIVLLGGGEAFFEGERMPGARGAAARRPGAGDAVVQGRPGAEQRHRADARDAACSRCAQLEDAARHRRPRRGDDASTPSPAACGAFAEEVHALRPHPGQVHVAAHLRELLARLDAGRHPVPPGAALPAVAAAAAGTTPQAQALRFDIGWDWVPLDAAPRPREVLPALPAVPRRQEAPAAGQLFAALHPAGARRGARCGGAGQARARNRAQLRSPTIRWCSRTCEGRARRGAGDFRRPLPRHAAGAGDELREGRDPGAGVDLRAPPQQAGRSGHQRRPAGLPDRQRGRHRVAAS